MLQAKIILRMVKLLSLLFFMMMTSRLLQRTCTARFVST
nr:MAG TPA: hypothetical protein [Bacteriophage sp.]